jgi:hypothetical protein
MRHINVLAARARALQGIYRTLQQPLGNEAVEPADNNSEAQTVGTQAALDFPELMIFRHARPARVKLAR